MAISSMMIVDELGGDVAVLPRQLAQVLDEVVALGERRAAAVGTSTEERPSAQPAPPRHDGDEHDDEQQHREAWPHPALLAAASTLLFRVVGVDFERARRWRTGLAWRA